VDAVGKRFVHYDSRAKFTGRRQCACNFNNLGPIVSPRAKRPGRPLAGG